MDHVEVRAQAALLTCRTCGHDLEPGSAREDDRSAPIETGFMDLSGLPEPPPGTATPWRV